MQAGSWETYSALCADDMTSLEPEAAYKQTRGIAFHKQFMDRVSADIAAGRKQMSSVCVVALVKRA